MSRRQALLGAALALSRCTALHPQQQIPNTPPNMPPDAPAISISPLATAPAMARTTSLDRASRLIAANNFQGAESSLRDFLAHHSDSGPAHRLLAYCLLRQNRPREALPEYTRAARILPPTAEDFKNVAQAYALLEAYPEATKWGRLSVERDPDDPDAWYSLGRIHYTDQKFVEAADCFRKALALVPGNMKAENNLGLALEGLNRNDEAVDAYRQAIAWGDASGQIVGMEQPLLNLSIVLIHRDKSEQALPLLRRASSIAPRDPRIHEQLGHLYLQKENLAAAQGEFEQAVSLDSSNAALHFLLGQTYRREGLQEKAQAEFALAAGIMGNRSSRD